MPKHTTTAWRHQVPEAAQAFGARFEGELKGAAVGMGKGKVIHTGDRQRPAIWGLWGTA